MVEIFSPSHPTLNPSKAIEPKEPRPWSPRWTAECGPFTETGSGILTPSIWKVRTLVTKFSVFVLPCDLTVSVDLTDGSVLFNTQLQFKPSPAGAPFRLIWFRRMEAERFTLDHNSAPPECLYYGVGWQRTVHGSNEKVGWKILPDGKLSRGL